MGGFENNVVLAKNLNFDEAAPKPHLGIINAAGKFPIGTGNSYPIPEILAGKITSPSGTLSIGYNSPNITMDLVGGFADLHVAKWIVNPTAGAGGNQTTIAAAIAAASSGDTIFITPGTYTENLTLKAGVNLTAFGCDSSQNGTGHVIISGTCTLTTAGSVTISGIQLQTNSAAFLAVTGTLASIVNLENCYLNCTNATGITFSSSSASAAINIKDSRGNLATTGIGLFANSSAGSMVITNCNFGNSGGSTTASTNSAGSVLIGYTTITFPLSASSTAMINGQTVLVETTAQNATCLTTAGTGISIWSESTFSSGSASAVSIGAGTSVSIYNCNVGSTNTNAITGAGTLNYSSIIFTNTSSLINTTTQTAQYTNLGKWKSSGQPAFLGTLAGAALNKTGTGTSYTLGTDALTEIFDQDNNFNTNGTFTAPVTGKYQLSCVGGLQGATILQQNITQIVTSNRTYTGNIGRSANSNDLYVNLTALADMDTADTATVTIRGFGEAGDTDDIAAGSFFSGFLAC